MLSVFLLDAMFDWEQIYIVCPRRPDSASLGYIQHKNVTFSFSAYTRYSGDFLNVRFICIS